MKVDFQVVCFCFAANTLGRSQYIYCGSYALYWSSFNYQSTVICRKRFWVIQVQSHGAAFRLLGTILQVPLLMGQSGA